MLTGTLIPTPFSSSVLNLLSRLPLIRAAPLMGASVLTALTLIRLAGPMNKRLRQLVVPAKDFGFCLLCGSKPCKCEQKKQEYEQYLKSFDLEACIEKWRSKRSRKEKSNSAK
jgi:hypothetical protein